MREKPDYYADKAKRAGYLARSVYKLEEIQHKHKLLARGQSVLDLGAAPGSWSQFALSLVGREGHVCAVDLQPLSLKRTDVPLTALSGDIFSDELDDDLAAYAPFDTLLSDAAPATSGNRGLDAARSAAVVERCLQLCEHHLKAGGNLAVKLFQGSDEQQLRAEVRRRFRKAATIKPKACRKDSFEIYLVGTGYKSRSSE